ncbi:NADPH:quinone oxidoreductase family protein [Aquisalinus flavus]|uniref:NADPH:quinone oxidoreductase n=1 Tax=Aquisalinus flavus TaxID=1526572 RepID=A0A8J2Y7U1_9PROT|nr:NADPH:quinone oxidoreductase family protein [Aquisalinus flavus]MBD0426616.1 NADPH:quinone oxidoreductase family protein [Aquisalinus flavus]UNE47840.1 NADPH:quinone oxidoreductase family protein [Aquisalinus flavus]GGD06472.1 NADPH:quinone oxidoreductase [Aquisalinus flavus]
MKALISDKPGGPETLELREMVTPVPGQGEVLIAVRAASANFPDTLVIRDLYQFKPPRPFAPGSEVAGVVERVGEGVTRFKEGDRVFALLTQQGGYATHAIAHETGLLPLPGDMPFEEAAAFMMTYGTSYYALKDRAHLQAGESLFISGASGGVGSAAIELGKAMGARVIAGVSSHSKAEFCKQIGADETIVYDTELNKDNSKDLSRQIKTMAGGDGVDVVYDAVGGAYAEPALRALAWEGRFLVVGFPAGIPSIPLNLTLLKSCQIVGVFWGAGVMRDPKSHAKNVEELFALYKDGKIKPRITERFTLKDAAKALEMLEKREATGKIVITMDD